MATDNLMVCFDGGFSKKEERGIIRAIKRKLDNHRSSGYSRPKRSKEKQLSNSLESDNNSEGFKYKESIGSNVRDVDDSKFISLDCEFVGVGERKLSALGRCSIVNFHNKILLDIYARPEEKITDYRTRWSGIRARDMKHAVPFEFAQNTIKNVLKDKILVGHALFNDLSVLKIQHPAGDIRDTAKCAVLKKLAGLPENSGPAGLKKLASILLGRAIQSKRHCSIEDAQATMDLFKLSQSQCGTHNLCCQLQHISQSVINSDSGDKSAVISDKGFSEGGIHTKSTNKYLRNKHTRRYSLDQHPYFKDEFWPSDLEYN